MEAYFRVIRTAKVVGTNTKDTPADRSGLGAVRDGFYKGHRDRRGGWNADVIVDKVAAAVMEDGRAHSLVVPN